MSLNLSECLICVKIGLWYTTLTWCIFAKGRRERLSEELKA